MTEAEARARAAEIAGEAMPLLERYVALLLDENSRQNLIARSTEATLWGRHLLDSLQLARFARGDDRTWLDVGTGAGFPGLVLATLGRWRMTLVEPRRRRADFLSRVVAELGLDGVSVVAADVRSATGAFDIVSARAVAQVGDIFGWCRGCSVPDTRFILPKGRSACADVDSATQGWQGSFHVEQSLTDPDAGIVIADRVSPR